MALTLQRPGIAKFKRAVIAFVLIAICLGMARLQLWRAETRGTLFEQQQSRQNATPLLLGPTHSGIDALAWRPVVVHGRWLADKTIYLDNKIYRQHPGLYALTPLELEGSQTVVLVNRGWLPAPRLRSDTLDVVTPTGAIQLNGLARPYETRFFEFSNNGPAGQIWQHVKEADYRNRTGLDALPVIVLQTDASSDGLVRDWSEIAGPQNPALRHYGYAAMWLVFALMAAVYSLIIWVRRPD